MQSGQQTRGNGSASRSPQAAVAQADGARAEAPAQYLAMLGERVRDARARHGMTRRMLAHDSGVSERYLAQLEGGRGNFSIALLRRVAAAIDIPLTELVSEQVPPVEYALLAQRLRRLTPAELAEAAALFAKRFGERPARLDRIALIGLRGAGKSTLGTALAQRLGWDFVELSREIERAAGMSVNEIFDLLGQAAYRRYERRAVENILRAGSRIVIAAGGGLVSELSTFERLLEACYTVWLQAAPREHWERVLRQGDYRMSTGVNETQAMADMRRILVQRAPFYGKADARIETSGKTPAESIRQLLTIVRKARAGGGRIRAPAAHAKHAK
jgi:XRE family transcriptional regulator, aerobic/anaerobic benzoate catabolism transcriptional regulator